MDVEETHCGDWNHITESIGTSSNQYIMGLSIENKKDVFHPSGIVLYEDLTWEMKIKLCSFVKTKTTATTKIFESAANNTTEKMNILSTFPIPAINTHLNFTKKQSPAIFEKFSPRNQNLSQCVCDPETFASDNPWILVGVGAGLLVAAALSVTACCW